MQVAVLLMDTQGAFDKDSKNKTETDIFTLSSLLSTVQIYNVKDNIDENVLRPLSVSILDCNLKRLLMFNLYLTLVFNLSIQIIQSSCPARSGIGLSLSALSRHSRVLEPTTSSETSAGRYTLIVQVEH